MTDAQQELLDAIEWVRQMPDKRAKLIAGQTILVPDLRAALIERGDEVNALRDQNTQLLMLLKGLGAVLDVAARAARQEVSASAPIEQAIDTAPFRNLMSTMYGLDPLGAPLPVKRSRKKKGADHEQQ